ncbi:MAG: hypothetical protein ACRYHA_05235 [Janthinobacterium lividum]
MSLMDVNRKRSFRPGRAAVVASAMPGAASFYFSPTLAAAAPMLAARAPMREPLDPAAITLSKWVSEHFDTLEHDDIAQFLVFGHAQFGRDG